MAKLKQYASKYSQVLRFAAVGVSGTVLDFGGLFILVAFGFPAIASNYVSTFVAMIYSFFMNKNYTFKNSGKGHSSQIIRFFAITVFGLWVIQPIILWGLTSALDSVPVYPWLILLFAKCWASAASMVWNYVMYSKFVFKKTQ